MALTHKQGTGSQPPRQPPRCGGLVFLLLLLRGRGGARGGRLFGGAPGGQHRPLRGVAEGALQLPLTEPDLQLGGDMGHCGDIVGTGTPRGHPGDGDTLGMGTAWGHPRDGDTGEKGWQGDTSGTHGTARRWGDSRGHSGEGDTPGERVAWGHPMGSPWGRGHPWGKGFHGDTLGTRQGWERLGDGDTLGTPEGHSEDGDTLGMGTPWGHQGKGVA